MMKQIDAKGIYYKDLNETIRAAIEAGETEFELFGINGQRYIGDSLPKGVKITIHGVPGNDLAAFMNGAEITVLANGQDGIGNTMNDGLVVVHGYAGDVLGYGMRGGRLLIKSDVGYRVGIHMKEYKSQVPAIVAGGTAGDFFGEYMAGGIMILLGLNANSHPIAGSYIGTGMHGGVIYLRGEVASHQLGKEVAVLELTDEDKALLRRYVEEFAAAFGYSAEEILKKEFIKLKPVSSRPYGRLYAY